MLRRKLILMALTGMAACSILSALPAWAIPVLPSGQAIPVRLRDPGSGYSQNAFLETIPTGGYDVFLNNNNGQPYSSIYNSGTSSYYEGSDPNFVYGNVSSGGTLSAPGLKSLQEKLH